MYTVELTEVTKKMSHFQLGEISLRLQQGEDLDLVGKNNSGKTLFLWSILGFTKVNSGEIRWFGRENLQQTIGELGIVLPKLCYPLSLSPKELGRIFAVHYPKWQEKEFQHQLEQLKIPYHQPIAGTMQAFACGLAVALAQEPTVLIYDPPEKKDKAMEEDMNEIQEENWEKWQEMLEKCEKQVEEASCQKIITRNHLADARGEVVALLEEGKLLLYGNRKELMENCGKMMIEKKELWKIAPNDYVKVMENGVFIKNKTEFHDKYPKFSTETLTLEEVSELFTGKRG